MVTVPIKDEYAEVLTVFGNLETAIDLALQRYTIEQITTKMAELRQRDVAYQTKYGLDYSTFAQRAATDEKFIQRIETANKLWEVDLADWEFCHKGIEDWSRKLQSILLG